MNSIDTHTEEAHTHEAHWASLQAHAEKLFDKKPDLNALLFLIGVQELGKGKRAFSKEEKQDLMHIAICKVLSLSGYYELVGTDAEGWPHWIPTQKLPFLKLEGQEMLLREHVVRYFREEMGWDF